MFTYFAFLLLNNFQFELIDVKAAERRYGFRSWSTIFVKAQLSGTFFQKENNGYEQIF